MDQMTLITSEDKSSQTGPEKSSAAEKVPVSEEDAALTSNSEILTEKFKCE